MPRTLHISLSPNATSRDAARAFLLLLRPWKWRRGEARDVLTRELKKIFKAQDVLPMNSGRWALSILLNATGFKEGSEVLVQAYTCVSVPAAVHWSGFVPVYVDINAETYTMDPHDLERRITQKSRALIIQHTFGIPADLDALLAIARKHNLIVIEDCAHTIGSKVNGKLVGTFGDAAILSFGRDKAFSSVFGGAAIVNHPEKFPKWDDERQLGEMSLLWTRQQLLHPLLTVSLVRPLYTVLGIGKALLVIFQKLGLLSKALTKAERGGARPPFPPALLPNALAELALGQLREREAVNLRRRQIAAFYETALVGSSLVTPKVPGNAEAVYLRYPIQCDDPKDQRKRAQREGIILGDWYDTVVAPHDTQLDRIGYRMGACPVAERVAARSVNLPTLPIMNVDDAKRVVEFVRGES